MENQAQLTGNLIKKKSVSDLDDFWKDCVSKPTDDESKGVTNENFVTFNDTPKTEIKSNLNSKLTLEHLITAEEIDKKIKESLKKKQAAEHCFLLYEKGKLKNEVNKIMFHKNVELKMQNELKECTWKPKLNKMVKTSNKETKLNGINIYKRNIQWKNKTNEKIKRSKSVIEENDAESLRPKTTTKANLEPIFDSSMTVFNSISNRNFIYRYGKARLEEEEKKKRLTPDLTKLVKDKWKTRILNKSSSITEKETSGYIQTLHDDLHSILLDEE